MKFTELKYERPDIKELQRKFNGLIEKFENAKTGDEQIKAIQDINKLRNNFETMSCIASIRYDVNTNDEYYDKERQFYDENTPFFSELVDKYYKALVNTKFRKEIEAKWGNQLFHIAELSVKTFSPEIIEDLQTENKLSSEYTKLIASAKIMFEGKERTIPQLGPFMVSPDREMRKKANTAKFEFFKEHQKELDDIYDKLVKVRAKIASKLGYNNFVELGYDRMMRLDYTPEMVENFRKQVQEYIVPVAMKLKERQAKRIGVDKLKYYDDEFEFISGNPTPKGEPKWIEDNASKMYNELSEETGKFFEMMRECELMDLVSKDGKAGGGYTAYMAEYNAPFIFSNFNGTSDDVDVLTHEAGHAFQVYSSSQYELPEYHFPTSETCEIHSMSMEFLTYPWMNLFFKEDEQKYKFSHLQKAIYFIPYGVSVDEFQHFVYANPDATPKERNRAWREIEKKYTPWKDYDSNEYLEEGGFWQKQAHIYGMPFYYIDYTLAQICALQFFKKSREDAKKAWEDYMKICLVSGSKPFLGVLKVGNLMSPFEDGCVESVVKEVAAYLDGIDDSAM